MDMWNNMDSTKQTWCTVTMVGHSTPSPMVTLTTYEPPDVPPTSRAKICLFVVRTSKTWTSEGVTGLSTSLGKYTDDWHHVSGNVRKCVLSWTRVSYLDYCPCLPTTNKQTICVLKDYGISDRWPQRSWNSLNSWSRHWWSSLRRWQSDKGDQQEWQNQINKTPGKDDRQTHIRS